MSTVYVDARWKLQRAAFHQEVFERETRAWFSQQPELVTAQYDPESGQASLVLREPVPLEWRLIVGDALQNARSCLEHIALAANLANSPDFEHRRSAFPILAGDWTGRAGSDAKSAIRGMSVEAQQIVREVQPSRMAPDHLEGDPLYALHELARIDRHQSLRLVTAVQRGEWLPAAEPIEQIGNVLAPNGMNARFGTKPQVRPGVQLTVTDGLAPSQPRDVHSQVLFDVAFDEDGEVAGGFDVSTSLARIIGYIDQAVLRRFESLD